MSRHPVFDAPSLPALGVRLSGRTLHERANQSSTGETRAAALLLRARLTPDLLAPRAWRSPGGLGSLLSPPDGMRSSPRVGKGTRDVYRWPYPSCSATCTASAGQTVRRGSAAVPMSVWYTKVVAGRSTKTFARTWCAGLKAPSCSSRMRGHGLEPMIRAVALPARCRR
jgi:hypothetical protein